MMAIASVTYLVGFLALYFSEPLFNSGTSPDTRFRRWEVLLWVITPGTAELNHPLWTLFQRFVHFDGLVERLVIVMVAGFVWTLAVMLGSLLLSTLIKRTTATRGEWIVLSAGLGIGVLACIVQGLGLAGVLDRHTFLLVAGTIIMVWGISFATRGRSLDVYDSAIQPALSLRIAVIIPSALVLGLALLSALLPTPDYDAHAYHLLGPKEWFLAGQIQFLPHNVYTSFPFLTEMMHLVGMVAWGDWFKGGLVGQTILAGFGVLTTATILFVTRRLFGENAGWLAGLIYATSPWTYRLTSIPYVEGPMLGYGMLGFLCLLRLKESPAAFSLIAGLCAGGAFGCKYPALLMVAAPLFVGMNLLAGRRKTLVCSAMFVTGFCLLAGIWLVRNGLWTGNPVFPLVYNWLGGTPWDAARNDRFVKGHQSTTFTLSLMGSFLRDIFERSDWQSALVFAFAPWALLSGRRIVAISLWGLMAYLFLTFFFTTHRLDRFFLTIEPIACVLAGSGFVVVTRYVGKWIPTAISTVIVIYNIVYCSTPLCGMNLYTDSISSVRRVAMESIAPSLAALNDSGLIKPDQTVLFVGLAAVYESPFPARYNTVFDTNILEEITRDPKTGQLRSAVDIRQEFVQRGISDVFVDWSWINRYRQPGNYGFTDFITPALFDHLVSEGILHRVAPALAGQPDWQLYQVGKEDEKR